MLGQTGFYELELVTLRPGLELESESESDIAFRPESR